MSCKLIANVGAMLAVAGSANAAFADVLSTDSVRGAKDSASAIASNPASDSRVHAPVIGQTPSALIEMAAPSRSPAYAQSGAASTRTFTVAIDPHNLGLNSGERSEMMRVLRQRIETANASGLMNVSVQLVADSDQGGGAALARIVNQEPNSATPMVGMTVGTAPGDLRGNGAAGCGSLQPPMLKQIKALAASLTESGVTYRLADDASASAQSLRAQLDGIGAAAESAEAVIFIGGDTRQAQSYASGRLYVFQDMLGRDGAVTLRRQGAHIIQSEDSGRRRAMALDLQDEYPFSPAAAHTVVAYADMLDVLVNELTKTSEQAQPAQLCRTVDQEARNRWVLGELYGERLSVLKRGDF